MTQAYTQEGSLPPPATCKEVVLTAELDSSLTRISGTFTCRVATSGVLYLARYPQILTDDSAQDELTARRVYPDGFDEAELTLTGPEAPNTWALLSGCRHNGKLWQAFGPAQAGQHLSIAFSTRVPNRLGSFGHHAGAAVLLGGWHPVLGTGPGPRPSVQHVPIRYRITVPEAMAGFVGSKPFGRRAQRLRRGQHTGTMVPMVVAPALHVHRAERALLVTPRPRHGTLYGTGDISAQLDERAHGQALYTAAIGAAFLQQAWAGSLAPKQLVDPFIVVVPLRDRLSEAFEGGVALSDRAFHLLPFETLHRFHRASLWREQFRAALTPLLCRKEQLWPSELLADATAAALNDRLRAATGAMAYAPELLQKFSSSPAVDQLIFAPQVPFPEVFYDAVDESRLPSYGFDRLLSPLPRGKLLYEKLRDLLGREKAMALLLRHLLHNQGSFEDRLRQRLGEAQAQHIMAWLGPYPEVDYALTDIASSAQRTFATVRLTGPDAARIHEPVTVAVTDRHNTQHRTTRMGPGDVAFDVPGPAKVVELDPDQRLVEKCHPPRLQARFNNREPKRYRLLLNDLSATLDVSGRALTANFDLLGRRLYDLRQDMHLGATFGPYSYGAQTGYARHFGREVTPLKLAHTASVNGAWSRLRGELHGEIPAGQLITLGLAYRYDTRLSRLTGLRGTGVDAVALGGLTSLAHRPRGTPWLQLGLSGLKIVPVRRTQALLLRLRFDAVLGDAPPQALLRLGGRYLGARGFQIGEAYGPKRALVSAEYRHVLVDDSRTDVFGLITLTTIEGAAFADGVHMPHVRPTSYGAWLGDVGYGVRIMGDVLGVSPATLAIDVARPLGRRAPGHAPITVYVAFVQSFLAF